MLYNDWLYQWVENYVKPSVKSRTYEQYKDIIRLRLEPHLGKMTLEEMTPLVVQQYICSLLINGNLKTGEGLSSNSINLIIIVLQNSLKAAYDLGVVDRYEMDKLNRPRTQEKQIQCFSCVEQKMIEKAVLSDRRTKMLGILMCLYTGLRIGELLALEWSDVNFEKQELYVRKTCYDRVGERVISSPKTKSSVRIIPIPKQIIPALTKLKVTGMCQYVISDHGQYVSIRSYQRSFALLLKKLCIPHRGFHALRHTFATRALECGMDVRTLAEILGHKNPTVTLNRYAHSLMEHKREMMNRLGENL